MRRRRRPPPTPSAVPAASPLVDSSETYSLSSLLLQRVHCPGVRIFRTIFAMAICYDSYEFVKRGELNDYFADATRFHARFGWPLPQVTPLNAEYEHGLRHALLASAAGIGLGPPRVRAAALVVFLGAWGYLFLCDAARYVNHYYLYLLVGGLLLAHTISSERRVFVLLLRCQFVIIYLYAGLTKCSAEWLVRHEPLLTFFRMATADGRTLSQLQGMLDSPAVVAAAAFLSAAFDVLVGFALWRRSTRAPAVALAAAFHLSNALIFNTIGTFPFVSLASCALFWPERADDHGAAVGARAAKPGPVVSAAYLLFAGGWLAWQALLPLRHHAHSADVSWTKLGSEFGWRLMADTTDGWISLDLVVRSAHGGGHGGAGAADDGGSVRVYQLHPQAGGGAPVTLPAHAIQQLCAMPAMLEQYVAAEIAAARRLLPHSATIAVHAECWKSVNGRPYQRWCDPSYDWASAAAGGALDGANAFAYIAPPASLAAATHAIARSIRGQWGVLPPWMLPRHVGTSGWGAPSAADANAAAAAEEWRAQGYVVEAFVDRGSEERGSEQARRPAWRDRILTSTGYREAWLVGAAGAVELCADAPPRWLAAERAPAEQVLILRPGQRAPLAIGRWHSLRAAEGEAVASWLYAMR